MLLSLLVPKQTFKETRLSRPTILQPRHWPSTDWQFIRKAGPAFLAYVERRLQSCPGLDLLRLNRFMGWPGADPTDTENTMAFLRNGLNPLLTRYQVACILNHHTPKTTNRQTDSWRGSDWMYAAAGGADITNWARAVIVIDPTHVSHVFKFITAKRGPRVGWVDEDFKKQIIRHFCHAEDGIYWRVATEDDLHAAQEAAPLGEVPVLRISLGKTLGYLEALWQILSAGEGIISRPQSIALIQKVVGHIVDACLPKLRRQRNCTRAVRQPIQSYPRLVKPDSVKGPAIIEITPIAG